MALSTQPPVSDFTELGVFSTRETRTDETPATLATSKLLSLSVLVCYRLQYTHHYRITTINTVDSDTR